jgi:hypothetical protein
MDREVLNMLGAKGFFGVVSTIPSRFAVLCMAGLMLMAVPLEAGALEIVWTKKYKRSSEGLDRGSALAVTPKGAVYVAGDTYVSGRGQDILVRKYSKKGRLVWSKKHNGPGNGDDYATGAALSAGGAVYVIGYIDRTGAGGGTGRDIWIRKYSRRGKKRWTDTYNGLSDNTDEGYAVAVAPDGSVYAVGRTFVDGQDFDVWVRKYSSGGVVGWTRFFNDLNDSSDGAKAVTVSNGGIYVAGQTVNSTIDAWLRKYDSGGGTDWTVSYDVSPLTMEWAEGVLVAGDGYIYMCGGTNGMSPHPDAWLVRMDSKGVVDWERTYNGPVHRDMANGCALASDGIYVTGETEESGEGANIWIRKYELDGDVAWSRTINGSKDFTDSGKAVASGPNNTLYVIGIIDENRGDFNLWLRKYKDP